MVILNEKIVQSAEINSKIYYIWDEKIIGFGLKVIPNGRKKYVLRYYTPVGGRKARQRWFLFGEANIYSCGEARQIAQELVKKTYQGYDPQKEKEQKRYEKLCEEFGMS